MPPSEATRTSVADVAAEQHALTCEVAMSHTCRICVPVRSRSNQVINFAEVEEKVPGSLKKDPGEIEDHLPHFFPEQSSSQDWFNRFHNPLLFTKL